MIAPFLLAFLATVSGAGESPRLGTPPAAGRSAAVRAVATVVGTLHHKGCQTAASGATVTVIGRDVSVTSDESGRFSLSLPAGVYSLVICGPNLVAGQRVDDVVLSAGQARDLGIVQVWPEERPPGCASFPEPPAEDPVIATAPETPSLELPGTSSAPSQTTPAQIWLRGTAGSGPGQFGMQGDPARDDEDALGPSSFAIGPMGSLYVLDALNGRVQRFDQKGKHLGAFPLPRAPSTDSAVESDLAVAEDSHVLVFTTSDGHFLTEYEPSGRVLVSGALPPSFNGVDLTFAVNRRPVFLMQNGQSVRAEMSWGGVRAEGPFPGLPVGDLYAQVERESRWLVNVKLRTSDSRIRRSVHLHSFVPVTGVRLVGVTRRGEMVVAVDRAEDDENAPAAEVLLLAVTPLGRINGVISVPPGGRRFEFREFSVTPDGAVVQMQSDAAEVRFVRWQLPPPPRDAVAGMGLLKGRVVESGQPLPGASVTVGRPRRPVPVASDGAFEVRLPAGTYLVSFRHPEQSPPGAPSAECQPVERRVTVAAGSVVDLGIVGLAAPSPGSGGSAWLDVAGRTH
jgi:hypothetical protein